MRIIRSRRSRGCSLACWWVGGGIPSAGPPAGVERGFRGGWTVHHFPVHPGWKQTPAGHVLHQPSADWQQVRGDVPPLPALLPNLVQLIPHPSSLSLNTSFSWKTCQFLPPHLNRIPALLWSWCFFMVQMAVCIGLFICLSQIVNSTMEESPPIRFNTGFFTSLHLTYSCAQ